MSHIPDVSDFLGILRGQYPSFSNSFFLDEQPISACPYILLPETPDQYLATLSKKSRHHLRRAMKALRKDHEVEFKKCTDGVKLPEQLQVLFELHQKRWQAVNVKSKFNQPEAREFYRAVSEAFYQNNWLDFSFLNVDGKPVSVVWGFKYNDTFHDMTIAFDINFSNYSVGYLHTVKLIEDTIRNGLKKFDFLKGDERYKSHWASYITNNVQITMAKRSLGGRCRIKLLQMLIKYRNVRQRRLSENFDLLLQKILRRREANDN
jgi:CelD/BcsL family acetyltransferase involved in cellulose biosynthesis